MKYKTIILTGTACLTLSAWAQTYSIDWHTIDGGGGVSSGGGYSLMGTIGQPDAGGELTGGGFTLTGGFWAPYAIQNEATPVLSILSSGTGQATLSWTPNTPGFVLQETTSLSPPNWVNSPSGSTNPVIVPVDATPRFYRLHKP